MGELREISAENPKPQLVFAFIGRLFFAAKRSDSEKSSA